MTIVQLPDEELEFRPGTYVKAFYATSPLSIRDFLKEVGGLDAIVMRGLGSWEGPKPIKPEEGIMVGDVLVVNPNHSLHPEASPAERPRQNYVIAAEVSGGYKIRKPNVTLLFEYDVPELFKRS